MTSCSCRILQSSGLKKKVCDATHTVFAELSLMILDCRGVSGEIRCSGVRMRTIGFGFAHADRLVACAFGPYMRSKIELTERSSLANQMPLVGHNI